MFGEALLEAFLDKSLLLAHLLLKEQEEAQRETTMFTDEALAVPADLQKPAALEFLRAAINTPSIEQVREMIQQEIVEFNTLNKIELKKGEEVKLLEDTPRHFLFPEVLQAVDLDIPVALVGPAGSGKSTLSEQVASALGLKYFLQNGVTGEHQLTGYMDAYGKYHTTTFRKAFEEGGFCFVDEADTSDAGAFKWINTAIANGHAMFPDNPEPIKRHKDFRIAIGANTYGTGADRMYVGANQLDASTLDRFTFFDFPYDEKLEVIVSGNAEWAKRVQQLRKAAAEEKARIVISPRASISGAKLLAIGWDQQRVEQRTIWKGIDPDLKVRIEKRAPLATANKWAISGFSAPPTKAERKAMLKKAA